MPPKKLSPTESKDSNRYRNFVITINNYTKEDVEQLISIKYKYLIYGKEGKRKTPHLQAYTELSNAVTISALSKYIPRAHIEPASYDADYNVNYCKKEQDFVELGQRKKQGKREDLDDIRTMAVEKGMRAVTKVGTAAQIKAAEAYLTYNEEPRDWKPNVFWIYGPAGVGKGRLADSIISSATGKDDVFVLNPIHNVEDTCTYEKGDSTRWWNGYDGHFNVVIDDFRHSWWPLTYLLKLLDRRPFQVENKGGMRQFRAKNIFITSIFPPEESYLKAQCVEDDMVDSKGEPVSQLLRRIDEIIELKYTFDDDKKYIEHQASYTNKKLVGTHHLQGRNVTSGIVQFEVDPNHVPAKSYMK